jgi:hypothetical protein
MPRELEIKTEKIGYVAIRKHSLKSIREHFYGVYLRI